MDRVFKLLYRHIIEWRVAHIRESRFIIFLSILVGIVSGYAAILLHFSVHTLYDYISEFIEEGVIILYFVLPLMGIVLTALFVKFVVRDDISHGVTKVLYAISRRGSVLRSHNMYSSMIGSTFTIGFGGSVGTEATIVLTGGAIGSNLARFFKMNYKVMTLMIGCGASAAIAGIFKAPIAGIVFTLEVLMLDLTMTSILPLMISAMTSYVLVYFHAGGSSFLNINTEQLIQIQETFEFTDVFLYIMLGLLCGLVSVYFIRTNIFVEKHLKSVKNLWLKIIMGGVLLGAVITLFPTFYGEGYDALQEILNNKYEVAGTEILSNSIFRNFKYSEIILLLYMVGLVLMKVVATALTNGSGGVGGVFAPSLFTGGMCGFLFVVIIEMTDMANVPLPLFVLAGMAGVMSGVMSSPMTAMFLIAEMTGSYFLLVPLMITAVVSNLASRGMEPHSIYARRLAKMGELITHNKDKAVMTLMTLDSVIETDFITVKPGYSLRVLVKSISKSRRNIFPVISSSRALVGVILLDDVRRVMFNQRLYDKLSVSDFMIVPPDIIDVNDPMDQVMRKFEKTKAWNLPVVNHGRYLGFVSKSRIYGVYREILHSNSED